MNEHELSTKIGEINREKTQLEQDLKEKIKRKLEQGVAFNCDCGNYVDRLNESKLCWRCRSSKRRQEWENQIVGAKVVEIEGGPDDTKISEMKLETDTHTILIEWDTSYDEFYTSDVTITEKDINKSEILK